MRNFVCFKWVPIYVKKLIIDFKFNYTIFTYYLKPHRIPHKSVIFCRYTFQKTTVFSPSSKIIARSLLIIVDDNIVDLLDIISKGN